jgi:hypothetical protein
MGGTPGDWISGRPAGTGGRGKVSSVITLGSSNVSCYVCATDVEDIVTNRGWRELGGGELGGLTNGKASGDSCTSSTGSAIDSCITIPCIS